MNGLFLLASAGPSRLAVELMFLFAAAAIVATVFRRFKLEAIPGYLVAGALIGPHALGIVRDSESIAAISGMATVMLMFGIGMELDLDHIRRGMAPILLIGLVSTLLSVLFGWGVLVLFGVKPPAALVGAMALSISSTAVFVRIIQQRRESRRLHGRIGIGISIVQDLLAVLFLAVIPPIALWAGVGMSGIAGEAADVRGSPVLALLRGAAVGLGGVAVLLIFGRYILPRVLAAVAKTAPGSPAPELMLVLSAALALGAAIVTGALGFSPEMGAFLAGFMLAATPYRFQIGGQLAPIRDLLLALFFTVVGLKVNAAEIVGNLPEILGGVVALVLLKGILNAATAWIFGASASSSVLAGAYLANAGEFSLVVAGAGLAVGVIAPPLAGGIIAVVILSLIVTPLLVQPAHALAIRAGSVPRCPLRRGASSLHDDEHASDIPRPDPEAGHVIIAGFGPVGRALAERFNKAGTPFTVIELNATTVERQNRLGRSVVFGDVTNPEVLESAGIRSAEAIVLTIPDEESTLRACRLIRAMAPGIFIATRTSFLSRAIQAQELGADHVVVEELATAEVMQREVLTRIIGRRERRAATRAAEPPQDPVIP